ncbi:MAG: electron transport complex subunit RsxC [Kiritimatiellia bacterium]
MSTAMQDRPGAKTFSRGIHPAENKELAEHQAIEVVPTPAEVLIPLLQHVGPPCNASVKAKDEVTVGSKIAVSDAFISAPIHATIDGVVGRATVATLPNGRHVEAIPIKAGAQKNTPEEIKRDFLGGEWSTANLERFTSEQIVAAVREAGIVGQGGAGFPTSVKIALNPKKPVDTVLVNGCECEPYLTADHRLMLESPASIITGALLCARASGADRILIAIEDNKPDAVAAMEKAATGTSVKVVVLKTKYPMGGEKQTILSSTGRIVPTGGLPLDVGVVVVNVATASAIARAVLRNKPLTHRIITVTGAGIRNPKNLLAPIGISYGELIEFCGGMTPEARRVVAGGPMMGFTIGNLATPVTKGTSGITVMTDNDLSQSAETACVRCGRCVDVCPVNLVPTKMALASRHQDWELAKRYHILACIECGCCGYSCPANIPLVQLIRMGKAKARE